MDHYCSNVVWVGFERCYLLRGIVIVDPELEVIGSAYDPVLSGNKSTSSNRDICKLKSFYNTLRFSQYVGVLRKLLFLT